MHLVVLHDHARLTYDGKTYMATQRRQLVNGGTEPVMRYLVRIAVDRYPESPTRSNEHYRRHPLTWEELELHATHDERDPMPSGCPRGGSASNSTSPRIWNRGYGAPRRP